MKTLYFLDTETTGDQPTDRLCQLAYKKSLDTFEEIFDELYQVPVTLSIGSQAVHHIRPIMLEGKPLFKESDDYVPVKELLESEDSVLVAHNAPFDVDMMEREDISPAHAIDTLRVVRHLDTKSGFKRHNLQFLRYAMDLDDEIDVKIQAHDAKGDIIILEKLFERLSKKVAEQNSLDLEKEDDYQKMIEKMIELSNTPVLLQKFAFGKHNGTLISEVAKNDPGYLQWLLKQKKQSESAKSEEDWIHTLEFYLSK